MSVLFKSHRVFTQKYDIEEQVIWRASCYVHNETKIMKKSGTHWKEHLTKKEVPKEEALALVNSY